MQREQFYSVVREALADHPEWMPTALSAVCEGMGDALRSANLRASQYDVAFRSALALANPERLSAETKAILNTAIKAAISPNNASKIEKDALDRMGAH